MLSRSLISCRILAAVTIVASLVVTSPAHSSPPTEIDKANARAIFNEGLDLRRADDHTRAREKFAAADALYPTPKTRFELGQEQCAASLLVEGNANLLSVANMAVAPGEEARYASVRTAAAALARTVGATIPGIRVVLLGDFIGDPRVTIDGHVVPSAARSEVRRENPGTHVVSVTWEGEESTSESVVLAAGENRVLSFRAPPRSAARAPAPLIADAGVSADPSRKEPTPSNAEPSKTSGPSHTWALVASGAGLAALGLGSALAVSARSTYASADPYCPGPGNLCTQEGVDLRRDAYSRGVVATSVLGIGVVAAVAATVLWLTSSKPSTRATSSLEGRLACTREGRGCDQKARGPGSARFGAALE